MTQLIKRLNPSTLKSGTSSRFCRGHRSSIIISIKIRNIQQIEEMFQTYHILFGRSTSLTSKGSCGLQSPEIKRKVVTARRGHGVNNRRQNSKQDGWKKRRDGQLNRWMRKETDDDFLRTISFRPFRLLFDPSATPHPAQGNENIKSWWVERGCSVEFNQISWDFL